MTEHCEEHSGVCVRMDKAENNITQLWNKWDSMQRWLIGILVSSVGTLVLVILGFLTQ